MQRVLVMLVAPFARQHLFMIAAEQRLTHRRLDIGEVGTLGLGVIEMGHGGTSYSL